MAGTAELRLHVEVEAHRSTDYLSTIDYELQNDAVGAQYDMLTGIGVYQNVPQCS